MKAHPALRILTLLCLAAATGCAGFADYQSARLVGPGQTELTPGASFTWLAPEDGAQERGSRHFSLRAAHGLSELFDLNGGVEYMRFPGGQRGVWVAGAGPKVALLPDRVALWVPVGAAFGEEVRTSRTWQLNPTLLLTLDASPEVDITPSVKLLLPLRERQDYLTAFNLGVGWTPPGAAWTLRPEGGFIFDPERRREGRVWHLGLGAGFPLGR